MAYWVNAMLRVAQAFRASEPRGSQLAPARRAILLAGLATLFAGCGRPANSAAPPPSPDSKVARAAAELPLHCPVIDAGVVYFGQKVRHMAWVVNRGVQPIDLGSLQSSCDCLTVRPQKRVLAPGERTLLIFEFDSAKDGPFEGGLAILVTLESPGQTRLIVQTEFHVEVLATTEQSAATGKREAVSQAEVEGMVPE